MTFWEPSTPDVFDPSSPSISEMLEDWDGLVRQYGPEKAIERIIFLRMEHYSWVRGRHDFPLPSSEWFLRWQIPRLDSMIPEVCQKIYLAMGPKDWMLRISKQYDVYTREDLGSQSQLVCTHPFFASDPIFPDLWADGIVIAHGPYYEGVQHYMHIHQSGMGIPIDCSVLNERSTTYCNQFTLLRLYGATILDRGVLFIPDSGMASGLFSWNDAEEVCSLMRCLSLFRDTKTSADLAMKKHKDRLFSSKISSITMQNAILNFNVYDPTWRSRWRDKNWTTRWVLQVSGGGRQDLTSPPGLCSDISRPR